MFQRLTLFVAGLVFVSFLSACQPRSTGEKVENAVEDAAHETKQGAERAGDKVKDATN